MKKINIYKSTILGYNKDDANGLKLGTKGYFCNYCEFNDYVEGELEGFTRTDFLTTKEYANGDCVDTWFNYFIPADKVVFEEEPKQIRAYTINEFLDKFPFLSIITLREKENNDCVLTCAFSAYRCRLICIDVCLGVEWISLGTLFDKFEYKDTLGNWLPFGVEE